MSSFSKNILPNWPFLSSFHLQHNSSLTQSSFQTTHQPGSLPYPSIGLAASVSNLPSPWIAPMSLTCPLESQYPASITKDPTLVLSLHALSLSVSSPLFDDVTLEFLMCCCCCLFLTFPLPLFVIPYLSPGLCVFSYTYFLHLFILTYLVLPPYLFPSPSPLSASPLPPACSLISSYSLISPLISPGANDGGHFHIKNTKLLSTNHVPNLSL